MCFVSCVFPRPSVVKQRFDAHRRARRRLLVRCCVIRRQAKRRTPHLALGAGGACRTAPVSGVGEGTLGRITSTTGLCTTPARSERSVSRHARADRRARLRRTRLRFGATDAMIPIGEPAHAAALPDTGDHSLYGTPAAPEPAHGRAPARGTPAVAGDPWAVESGEDVLRHEIEVARALLVNVGSVMPPAQHAPTRIPETKKSRLDDRLTKAMSGLGRRTRGCVVHRLVNIGTRLPEDPL
jgi:hypothetical protein